jgi:gas vesicle protein
MRKGKLALGALIGLASGAIAGILFAPEKGSETRKQIKNKADDYAGDLKSKYNKLRDSLTKKFKSTKKDAEMLADDAKREVENTAASYKHPSGADVSY